MSGTGTSAEGIQEPNFNLTRQGDSSFGDDGPTTNINTTLLVPAFLISGVLLIGILAILLWKRTAFSRAIAALEATQTTPFRVTRQGSERTSRRDVVAESPRERPKLWDMWIEEPLVPRESNSNLWEIVQVRWNFSFCYSPKFTRPARISPCPPNNFKFFLSSRTNTVITTYHEKQIFGILPPECSAGRTQ